MGLLLLCGAALAVYIAARATVDAVTREEPSAWRRAMGHWIPIALTALYAIQLREWEIALGVIFASSVASVLLVTGLVCVISRPSQAPPEVRRVWPFVLPAGLIALMAGFRSEFTLMHAAVLAIEGVLIFILAMERRDAPGENPPGGGAVADMPAPALTPARLAELFLGVLLAGCGAYLLVQGTLSIHRTTPAVSGGLIAAMLISPILTLPMIGSGARLGERGTSWASVGANIGVVLLNLCVLLPAVIAVWHLTPKEAVVAQAPATTIPVVEYIEEIDERPALPFPLAVWRIDTVVLVIAGFLLLPVALGRWTISRGDGALLVLGYLVYLVMSGWLGLRR